MPVLLVSVPVRVPVPLPPVPLPALVKLSCVESSGDVDPIVDVDTMVAPPLVSNPPSLFTSTSTPSSSPRMYTRSWGKRLSFSRWCSTSFIVTTAGSGTRLASARCSFANSCFSFAVRWSSLPPGVRDFILCRASRFACERLDLKEGTPGGAWDGAPRATSFAPHAPVRPLTSEPRLKEGLACVS